MEATLINVAGTGRSGSTMLHLILGSASNAVAVGEVINWFRPVKSHHFDLQCACGRVSCRRWDYIEQVREPDFHASVAERTGARYVVDSSKEISWLIDSRRWAKRSGMSCINLFVWKNPLELAYSFWKRGGSLMLWRSEFLKYYKRVFEAPLPVLTLNIGDLIDDPRSAVYSLTRTIAMDYEEGMERFWDFEHHHLFGNYGVRRQTQIGESAFVRTTFPEEFKQHIPHLRDQLGRDDEVHRLIYRLRRADVLAGGQPHVEVDREPLDLSHPFPFWYYAQKGKRRLRRYRPEQPSLELSHSVATIPVTDAESSDS